MHQLVARRPCISTDGIGLSSRTKSEALRSGCATCRGVTRLASSRTRGVSQLVADRPLDDRRAIAPAASSERPIEHSAGRHSRTLSAQRGCPTSEAAPKGYSGWKRASVFPSGSLNQADLPMPRGRGDVIDGRERREVIVLEDGAPALELSNVALDVVRPEPHLRVIRLVRCRSSIDEERRPVAAVEEKVVRDRFRRECQLHHLLVEHPAPLEIARAEDG